MYIAFQLPIQEYKIKLPTSLIISTISVFVYVAILLPLLKIPNLILRIRLGIIDIHATPIYLVMSILSSTLV